MDPLSAFHGQRLILQGFARTRDNADRLNSELRDAMGAIPYLYYGDMRSYLREREIEIGDGLDILYRQLYPGFTGMLSYHLIGVPAGVDVGSVTAEIYRRFDASRLGPDRPRGIERIEPDIELNLSQPQSKLGTNFDLYKGGSKHNDYKTAMKCPSSKPTGSGVKIAIVDSGIESGIISTQFYDVTKLPSTAHVDGYGHGTAMATIVRDIAPDAEVYAIRVTDNGKIFVWDLMAAISTATFTVKANIINLSLGCTHLDQACSRCGGYGGGRSTVFQHFLEGIQKSADKSGEPDPLFVGAVGNGGLTSGFEWPARFNSVLAVGAVTIAKDRSSFSNRGTNKPNYVMCPGGEWDDSTGNATEWVGEGQVGSTTTYCVGTSPATAYATALLALYRQHYVEDLIKRGQAPDLSAVDLLDKAINKSAHDVTSYSSTDHGKGRFVYDP